MSRILVVDDDKTTRHVLRQGSDERWVYDVGGEGRCRSAQGAAHAPFDLLLLDVWMPRMTGLDLLEQLATRKTRPRVIVMTSDDAPETLLKAVREQAFKYVHKPVDRRRCCATVRDALEAPEPRRSR